MNSPLVVRPAKVDGGILNPVYPPNPAQTIHFGVPLALFTSADLLKLEIPAWDNQQPGETGWLSVNKGNPIFMKTIQPGEEGKSFFHDVPKAYFNNGINTVVVQARNSVQPGGTDSIDLYTLVYIPRPGGEVAGAGANPNLTFTVSHTSVGPTEAANGVDVTMRYTHMRIGDIVTLYLDGKLKTQTVTPTDLQLGYVQMKLLTPDFAQDNNKFELKFLVDTSLGDRSGPQAIWSALTYIDVHVKQPGLILTRPSVLEAKLSGGTVMDFNADFYYAEHATVQVKYTGSDPGQTIYVECIGRAETYTTQPQPGPAPGQALLVQIPRRVIIDSIAHKIQFRYYVRPSNTTQYLPSNDLDVNILPQRHICGVPTINGPLDNLRLYAPNPLEAPYTARISLTIDGEQRQDSGELPYPYPAAPYMNFAIPPSWISSNRGKTLYLNYSIRRTGSTDRIIFSPYIKVFL